MFKKIKRIGLVAGLLMAATALMASWATGLAAYNVPAGIASATNATVLSTAGTTIVIPNGPQGMVLTASDSGASTNTVNAVHGWDVTMDGTNWTQNGYFRLTNTLVAGTAYGALQLTREQMAGIQGVRDGYYSTGVTATPITNNGGVYGFFQ